MEPITKTLLKNVIFEMLREDEEYFKQNIIQALSIKLNDCITETKQSICKKLMLSEPQLTENNTMISGFVSFLESFEPGKFKFKDESIINITESDIENIKVLFEKLNGKNRLRMVNEVFKNPNNFKQHINFSKSTKEIL
jgi:hypothetical protein